MIAESPSVTSAVADLPQGRIAYRAAGPSASSRPPAVLVHGLLTDARLWDPVARRLAAAGIRSYAPTIPLGSHQEPMRAGADLSPNGVAQLVRDFIAALGLSSVTLVGNDTGGAICQLVLAGERDRIGAAVLTDCDAFRAFPPRPLAPLFAALRHPGLVAALGPALRTTLVRHGPLAYGPLARGPLDRELTGGWVKPLADKAIRRDLAAFARGVQPGALVTAARSFGQVTEPVRILWGDDDRFFRPELGRQLSEAFPRATLTVVPGGRTFLPLDHPDRLADEIMAV